MGSHIHDQCQKALNELRLLAPIDLPLVPARGNVIRSQMTIVPSVTEVHLNVQKALTLGALTGSESVREELSSLSICKVDTSARSARHVLYHALCTSAFQDQRISRDLAYFGISLAVPRTPRRQTLR